MMMSKIAKQHLSRVACIYIRQSTPGQVRFNQESTERQYNLKSKAQSLGWNPEKIRILDRDLGHSGAHTTNREDFKTLVSDVAMGQVGAIFSLEASRLARSNKDWHRLLELCAITGTLVIDEDGCYDPSEFNDSLVLGLKGTFAQAELHIIRARLHGGDGVVKDVGPDLIECRAVCFDARDILTEVAHDGDLTQLVAQYGQGVLQALMDIDLQDMCPVKIGIDLDGLDNV